jgi:hypothetical protein
VYAWRSLRQLGIGLLGRYSGSGERVRSVGDLRSALRLPPPSRRCLLGGAAAVDSQQRAASEVRSGPAAQNADSRAQSPDAMTRPTGNINECRRGLIREPHPQEHTRGDLNVISLRGPAGIPRPRRPPPPAARTPPARPGRRGRSGATARGHWSDITAALFTDDQIATGDDQDDFA